MSAAADTLAALRTAVIRIEGQGQGRLDRSLDDGFDARRRIAVGVDAVDATLGGGLRRGAVHAVSGATVGGAAAATGFAVALAVRAALKGRTALWIRQDMAARENGEPWAPGFSEFGLDPDRLVMVRAIDEAAVLKAAEAALGCAGLSVALIEPFGRLTGFDRVAVRRLALAANQSGATGIILRAGAPSFGVPAGFSAAETRWRLAAAASDRGDDWGRPRFSAELVRNRRGGVGTWALEWNGDERGFRLLERDVLAVRPQKPWPADPRDRAAEPGREPSAAPGEGAPRPVRRAG